MTICARITDLLGIEHPIVHGGMMWVGRAELAGRQSTALKHIPGAYHNGRTRHYS